MGMICDDPLNYNFACMSMQLLPNAFADSN